MKGFFSSRSKDLDVTSQKELYQQFYQLIYRVVYRYCGDAEMTQDIVQETFLRAFRYFSTFKEDRHGSFEGWLITIAKNETFKHLKRQWKRNEIPVDEINMYKENISFQFIESIEHQIEEQEIIEEIFLVLDSLTLRHRQILLLRLYHDYSFKEIGNILGIQENAARQIYHRAKKALLEKLSQKWGTNDGKSQGSPR